MKNMGLHNQHILPNIFHNMVDNYLKLFPKFNGENEVYVDDHQSTFQYCIDIIVIEHEYLYLNIFVHSLEGDA